MSTCFGRLTIRWCLPHQKDEHHEPLGLVPCIDDCCVPYIALSLLPAADLEVITFGLASEFWLYALCSVQELNTVYSVYIKQIELVKGHAYLGVSMLGA